MLAMRLHRPGRLVAEAVPDPEPGPGQVLLKVAACGVCRTDLHVVDGELPGTQLPDRAGARDRRARGGDAGAGVGASPSASGSAFPGSGGPAALPLLPLGPGEPLRRARASPATRSTAAMPSTRSRTRGSAFALPDGYADAEAAPLLCAGLIGYRALAHGGRRRSGSASTASARRRTSWRRWRGTRGGRSTPSRGRGDREAQALCARSSARRGPAGRTRRRRSRSMRRSSSRRSGRWCPRRCAAVRKGGTVVCAGIHMSDIPSFPYAHPVGRAERALGGQPDPRRWRGVPGAGATGAGAHGGRGAALSSAVPALDRLRAGEVTGALVLAP